MPDATARPAVTSEQAERIGQAVANLLNARRTRDGLWETADGKRGAADLGYRVLRLVDEVLNPGTVEPEPKPKPATKQRRENGWTVAFVARDRADDPWTIWKNDGGEHQVSKGEATIAEAPAAASGGWRDLNRLMKLRGLVERPG
jgi:hypothetical protein